MGLDVILKCIEITGLFVREEEAVNQQSGREVRIEKTLKFHVEQVFVFPFVLIGSDEKTGRRQCSADIENINRRE